MYENIIKSVTETIWAIAPAKLEQIMAVLDVRMRGMRIDAETVREVTAAARKDRQTRNKNRVAVLPVLGTLYHRADMFTEASGFTSAERLAREFDALVEDAGTSAIVLDMDSPGGMAMGTKELADKIFAARGSKPIVAVANAYAASAAYYLASAADEVVVTPTGQVGSIGTMAVHVDQSGLNEQVGLKPTYIHYGKHKVEGNPDTPLDDEAREEIQKLVDSYGRQFEADVAKYRDRAVAVVRSEFGQGRMFTAQDATTTGLADKVDTLEGTLQRLSSGGYRRPRRSVRTLKNTLALKRA